MLTIYELMEFDTFEERLLYLSVESIPSELTFADLRFLNQRFYNSRAWRQARSTVIARDLGFDLAIPGRDIYGNAIVHHMNPLKPKDLQYNIHVSLDPRFLITVSHMTHEAIHFGTSLVPPPTFERVPGDTTLW